MSEVSWIVALLVLLLVICAVGAAYMIVEWIYSDVPSKRRPWHRWSRTRPPDDESPR